MTEIQFGTIRVDNDIMSPGELRRKDGVISLGDSGLLWENNLRWIYYDGKLISDRSAIFGVDYDELEVDGLCYGKAVVIDSMPFTVRLMDGDLGKTPPSEVDQFLDEHGIKMREAAQTDPYWCLSTKAIPPMRLFRGGSYLRVGRYDGYCRGDDVIRALGYRPVLIPEAVNPKRAHLLQGKHVYLYGPKGFVDGILSEITDYDLTLEVPRCLPSMAAFNLIGCAGFARKIDRYKVAVNRDQVRCIQLVQAGEKR